MTKKDKLKFALFPLVTLLILAAFFYTLDRSLVEHAKHQRKTQLNSYANQLSLKLERILTEELSRLEGLALQYTLNPDYAQESFLRFAAHIKQQSQRISHLAIAPDFVIENIYPLKGNESAVGLDYRKVPKQWQGIQRAVIAQKTILDGPITLVQGGTAFIARTPIYYDAKKSKPWGILATVFYLDEVLLPLREFNQRDYAVQLISKQDNQQDEVIWQSGDWDFQDFITQHITLPVNEWQLRVASSEPMTVASQLYTRLAAFVSFLSIIFLFVSRYKQEALYVKNQALLSESERKYRYFFEKANDAIYIIDRDTAHILDLNEVAARRLFYSKQELIGKPVSIVSADEQRSLENFERLKAEKSLDNYKFRSVHRRKDGTTLDVEIRTQIIELGGKKVFESVVHDISEMVAVQKALKRSKVAAESANNAKTAFITNMSHELRTPLNGILASLQLLNNKKLDSDSKELIDISLNSGKVLLEIISDIIDISRLDEGKISLHKSAFSPKNLVTQVYELLNPSAEAKGLDFQLEIEGFGEVRLMGDEVRLRQVLYNLVGNAIKFTVEGFVKITLNIIPKDDCYAFICEVQDSGIGIDATSKHKIFNRFEHTRPHGINEEPSSGLGLAIVAKLAELMDGNIQVNSRPNVGSTFIFTADFESASQALSVEKNINEQRNENSKQYKVLVAEDNKVNQLLIKKYLIQRGHQVELATDGSQVIDKLAKDKFDFIFMDIQMPVLNGLETVQLIRSEVADWHNIPVIALTADAISGQKEYYLQSGFDGYLSKPLSFDELEREVARVMQ